MATADTEVEIELRQRQKLNELRVQTVSALLRWWWLAIAAAVVTAVALACLVRWRVQRDPYRCESQTNLAFCPKRSGDIQGMDNAQLLRVITRRTLFDRISKSLGVASGDPFDMFEVSQDGRDRNFYAVKAYASTEGEAIRRVNAFADAAISEYRAFRLEDLRGRIESVDRRKAEIAEEERKLEAEESALNRELGVVRPAAEMDRLLSQVSDRRRQLIDVTVKVGEAESQLKVLGKQLAGVDTAILDEANTVKKFTDKLADVDKEIEKLRLVYTDENPRLGKYLDERREVQARYEEFLSRFGMKNARSVDLVRIDALVTQARTVQQTLESQQLLRKALLDDIDRCNARIESLSRVLPRYERLNGRSDALKASRLTIEESEASLLYLEASVKNEFYQIERATTASKKQAVSRKKLTVIVAGGVVTGGLAFLLVALLELAFGKIRRRAELEAAVDVSSIGAFGRGGDDPEDIFIRFSAATRGKKSVLLVSLPGVATNDDFVKSLSHSCRMTGVRVLFIDLLPASSCRGDWESGKCAAVAYRGDRGVMPVVNPHWLSVHELATLEADLKTLQGEFDLVVVMLAAAAKAVTISVIQLNRLCESTLGLAAIRATPRKALRRLAEVGSAAGRPVFALGLIRSALAALLMPILLGGCYFNRLTGNFERYPDLVDVDEGAVAESRLTQAELRERDEFLMKLDQEPPEEFRINAEDKLNLVVYDHPDISGPTTVTPDGCIGLVFLGQVKVAGLTLGEAAKKIEDGLGRYLKKPAVGLSPTQIASQTVTLFGGVANPGVYPISSDMRLADLYAKAGGSAVRMIDGLNEDVADFSQSYLFRSGYERALPIDFEKAILGGDSLHNVRLRKGDRIVIGMRTGSYVAVVGDVKTPHRKLWRPDLNLLDVMVDAGWATEEHWSKVIVIRGGMAAPRLYKVGIDDILAGNRPNVRLAPGDIVYVPHDNITEYNVFIRKLMPTGQLFNLLTSPFTTWSVLRNNGN